MQSGVIDRLARAITALARRSRADLPSGVEADLARGRADRAFAAVRRMAARGHAEAQYRLGQIYEKAEEVVQSLADAVHWYRLAAEQGHVGAQARLGLIYLIEPPAPASVTADASERVVDAELPPEAALSQLFPRGFVIRRDPVEAAKWNRRAAEAGSAEAQARLAYQFAVGEGVARDYGEAERWFTAAALQGNAAGQVGLGVLYAGGYGAAPIIPAPRGGSPPRPRAATRPRNIAWAC